MKSTILILLLFVSFTASTQDKTGVFLGPVISITNRSPSFGGQFVLSVNLPKSPISIGAGFEVVKLNGLDGVTLPVYLDTRVYISDKSSKIRPFINLSPGYVIYKKSVNAAGYPITTKGSFFLNAGIGILGPQKGKNLPAYFTINYRRYGFTVDDIAAVRQSLTFTFGVLIITKKKK